MSIEKLAAELIAVGIENKFNMPLAPASTFKIGGACAIAAFPQSREELARTIRFSRALNVRYTVVGKASNILFADDGFDGMIIFTSHMTQITEENGFVYAEAGVGLGALATLAAKRALSGLEFAYGIPGSIGGAVFCALAFLLYGFIVHKTVGVTANYPMLLLSGLVLSLVSQVGDLAASLIKREHGVKDYGKIMPGHGGVMDRFDSILAVAPVLLLLCGFATAFAFFY